MKTRPALGPKGVIVEQVSLHSSVVTSRRENHVRHSSVRRPTMPRAYTAHSNTAQQHAEHTVQWTCSVYVYGVDLHG